MDRTGAARGRTELDAGLVAIARDFLDAHHHLTDVARSHRDGSLDFASVKLLVGDDESTLLFRLKECSHALFRPEGDDAGGVGPEALFDLAVGSLFHEAMKFRENFYQRAAYGPKIETLRSAPLPEAQSLVSEFEKILADAAERIEESILEAETLLAQTTQLFRVLLRAHCGNGLLGRFLLENGDRVREVFGQGLDELLAEVYGCAAEGWSLAARSYLDSGFFAEAGAAAEQAEWRGARGPEIERIRHYARGMQAFLQGGYTEVVQHLEAWAATPAPSSDRPLVELALTALTRLGALAGSAPDDALPRRAAALVERIGGAAAPGS